MPAKIIDGKAIANQVRQGLTERISQLRDRGCFPRLSVVLVGENPASEIYVRMKTRACEELGIRSDTSKLPSETGQDELLKIVNKLNSDPDVHAILVQLPLPSQIDERAIVNAISPAKDVDGFHPTNRGKLVTGEATFVPCTPLGVQEMLLRSGHQPAGKHVVIVGRSKIVGLPLASILVQKKQGANATVTVCHSGTRNLNDITRSADILVAAMGSPEFIKGNMIRAGAVVIDVGVNRVENPKSERGYRIVGDVEFASAVEVAGALSPVPGGVGPMTIAMLMKNTIQAAEQLCASSSTG